MPQQHDHDEHPHQLTIDHGRQARDDGMHAAELNTFTPSRDLVAATIAARASTGETFTSDDVLDDLGGPPLGSVGALGALVNAAARSGLIVGVGFVQSRRPSRRGAWIRQWRGAE